MKKLMTLAVAALVLSGNAMQAAGKPIQNNGNHGPAINKMPSKPITQHGPVQVQPQLKINGLPIIASKPTHNWYGNGYSPYRNYYGYPTWYRNYCFFNSYPLLNWGWYYPTWYGSPSFFGW